MITMSACHIAPLPTRPQPPKPDAAAQQQVGEFRSTTRAGQDTLHAGRRRRFGPNFPAPAC